jgi:hypothetical protein
MYVLSNWRVYIEIKKGIQEKVASIQKQQQVHARGGCKNALSLQNL